VLCVAFELGVSEWKITFSTGLGQQPRHRVVPAPDLLAVQVEVDRAKARSGLPAEAAVASCYEAGRDGFWLRRALIGRREWPGPEIKSDSSRESGRSIIIDGAVTARLGLSARASHRLLELADDRRSGRCGGDRHGARVEGDRGPFARPGGRTATHSGVTSRAPPSGNPQCKIRRSARILSVYARCAPVRRQMNLTVPDTRSDAALAAAARAGDACALGALYHRYAEPLFRTAYRLLGSADEAEDVVQDLFVGLPEALGKYHERGALGGWLRTVVTRMALMHLRAGQRRTGLLADSIPDRSNPEALDAALLLQRALGTLPEPLRSVFILKEVEGYTHGEIAELLGIRRGTSEVRLHRAIRVLKDVFRRENP
jgi:RNA polymerase sigma-70 factor, ECF subfamily